MPELPEVETVARGLAERITGLRIATVHLLRPEILRGHVRLLDGLVGCRIQDVRRRGKQIHMLVGEKSGQPRITIVVHLGMTGRLLVADSAKSVEKHTHLRMGLGRGARELRFCDPRRFGGIWLLDKEVATDNCTQNIVGALAWRGRRLPPIGTDPMSLSLAQMCEILQRNRQIKALLLDQRHIGGLGNIYCDEMLFRAGVHPSTPAADLNRTVVRKLRQAMLRVLTEAIRAGGSSISDYRDADNQPGSFQTRHRVYGRAGEPCRNCGHAIERLVVAGRGTYICPICQPMP